MNRRGERLGVEAELGALGGLGLALRRSERAALDVAGEVAAADADPDSTRGQLDERLVDVGEVRRRLELLGVEASSQRDDRVLAAVEDVLGNLLALLPARVVRRRDD